MFLKGLSIRKKLIGSIIFTVLTTAILISAIAYHIMREALMERFNERAETAAQTIIATREVIKQKVKAYANLLSKRPDIIDAVAKKDEATLERILVSVFKTLHELDNTIRTLEATDDKGIVIMRGHNPKKKGDDKSKVFAVHNALLGEATSGVEVSPTTGEMAYDAVYPLKLGDKVVGTLKVGSYFREETANYLKSVAKVDVVIFSGNKVNVSTLKDGLDLTLSDEIMSKMKPKEAIHDTIMIKGQRYRISYIPIIDPEGKTRGAIAGLVSYQDLETSMSKLIKMQALITVGIFILLSLLGVLMIKPMANSLLLIVQTIDKISEGDLRVRVPQYKGKDEVGKLVQNMNRMLQSFNTIIRGIRTSANNLVSTVDLLRGAAEKTAKVAQNQSLQASRIAASAEEMTQTIADIAKNATSAEETASSAMNIAENGKKIMDDAANAVGRVNALSLQLSSMIEKLNKRAEEIGEIVGIIKNIADQTNLLALNASIEAARAGEHGRSFAVVADEVKKLAVRTIEATETISEKISTIQKETEETSKLMESASNEVSTATNYIKEVENSLNQIVEAASLVRDQIAQIASAISQQSSATEEIARNIEKSSNIAKELEKMSDEVAHEVNRLTKIAEELKNSTAGFKTKENEL